ncbi:MAG: flagellar basal body-associated FliL family protein [Gammaproteobacteria bacterium]|nr:flagellar basal body-associated FliL family protein [Gammaproteobacteria bacterium]
MAEEAKNKESNGGASSPMKLVVTMIVGGILLVAVSIGGVFFMMKSMGMLDGKGGGGHKQEHASATSKPVIYFPLEPAFVVNFKDRGRTRFLQVTMDVTTADGSVIDEMKKHMPLIRNNILILLSKQDGDLLQSAEGKEKIREAVLKELQEIMTEKTGMVKTVEALYITSFVTQ